MPEYNGDTYTVVSIGKEAFYKNKNIESLEIPSTVKTIGNEAFEYCAHLKGVVFSRGLVKIESEAFKACPIEKIDLPNTVTYIGERAFFTANANTMHKSKIKWVSIPESVQHCNPLHTHGTSRNPPRPSSVFQGVARLYSPTRRRACRFRE